MTRKLAVVCSLFVALVILAGMAQAKAHTASITLTMPTLGGLQMPL